MKTLVINFPGTNCDHDAVYSLKKDLDCEIEIVWHQEKDLPNADLIIIPGGFSFGDYLRTGAMAKLSPISTAIKTAADRGVKILGICNGFQILCELELLPGVLLKNRSRRFISKFLYIKKEKNSSCFVSNLSPINYWPVAHFEGNYFCEEEQLKSLEDNNQVVIRYCNEKGIVNEADTESNPNGSIYAIAGICNKNGNIMGLMPHPERIEKGLRNLIV